MIPVDKSNKDYISFLNDLESMGPSIIECFDCEDGIVSNTWWQYAENAEEILATKYGSDPNYQKLSYDLKCDRYARAKRGLTPYISKADAFKVIDATPQDIQDAMRHIPMRS